MEWTHTLGARVGVEMLGSLMTYCVAVGAVANALLPRTKGEGMGLLAIALCVGLGIGLPIAMFWRVSAFFNPGILMAETVRGRVAAGDFWALLAAELVGYFAGALVLYVLYFPHLNAAVHLPAADEVDRLLLDPAVLNDTALLNASYNLGAPSVTTPASFWRFAVRDLKEELSKAWHARKVADPFRTCPGDMKMACETSGAGFSRRGTEASETAGLDEEAHWGGGSSSGGEESLKRRSGPHLGTAAAAAAAEEGRHGGGGSGSDGTEGAPAATFAQRMAGHAGPLRSRGHLAAVLCKARQDVLLSVFVTRPAVWSPFINVCQEFIAMTIMATGALLIFEQGKYFPPGLGTLWPPFAGMFVGLLNAACILSLGGTTGPAINPARDLGPRIAFSLLPIPGKGCSEWFYGWVPVLGGLAGGAAAGGLVAAISQLLA